MAVHLRMRDANLMFDQGINTGHAKIAHLPEYEIPLTSYRVTETLHWKYSHTIPVKKKWERGKVEFQLDSIIFYTDVLRMKHKAVFKSNVLVHLSKLNWLLKKRRRVPSLVMCHYTLRTPIVHK